MIGFKHLALVWISSTLVFLAAVPGPARGDEDYGPDDAGTWLENVLDWKGSPVDLSGLNHRPAGAKGHVVARGDRLIFEKTGEPARFWSINVAAQAVFGPEDEEEGRAFLKVQADRIAALGFNHVRLHHYDLDPGTRDGKLHWGAWSGPGIVDYREGGSLVFYEPGLDRVDYFIHLLKERGIYVYVDLFNLRKFAEGDGLTRLVEMRRVSDNKYVFHLDEELQRNMVEFAVKLGQHRNPHTGLTWAEDPAICMAVLANENDFTFYTTGRVMEDEFWRSRARELAVSYGEEGLIEVDPDEAIKFGSEDHNRFAARVEEQVYGKMITALKEAGWKALISAGNWSFRGPVSVIGKARSGDFTDNHAYQSETTYLLDDPVETRTIWARLGLAHSLGLPFVISEWQTGRSARDAMHLPHRATSVIGSAVIGAHQGWDAVSFFNYSQTYRLAQRGGGGYNAALDPAHMGVMPAAALLYRRDLSESPETVVVRMSPEQIYGGEYDGWATADPGEAPVPVALKTGMEKHRTVLAFPGDEVPDEGVIVVAPEDHGRDFVDGGDEATLDTGEATRNWAEGWQRVDTPRGQVVQGFLGKRRFETADVVFETANAFGVIAVNALDGEPISGSGRLLLTAMGRCERLPGRPENYRSQVLGGAVSIRCEDADEVRVTPVRGDGDEMEASMMKVSEEGRVRIPLDLAPTHWFRVEVSRSGEE